MHRCVGSHRDTTGATLLRMLMQGMGQLSAHGSIVIGHTLCDRPLMESSTQSPLLSLTAHSAFSSGPQIPQGFFLLHRPSKHHSFLLWGDLLDVLVLSVHVVSLLTELRAL